MPMQKKCQGVQIYSNKWCLSDLRPVQQRCGHLSSLIAVIIYGLEEKYYHDIMKPTDEYPVNCYQWHN